MERGVIFPTTVEGFDAWTLENDALSLTIVPSLGAKGISLTARLSGREYLWRNSRVRYRPRQYGDPYGDYDASGWDECFPTIRAVRFPGSAWNDVPVPDHGELWYLPWQVAVEGEALSLWTDGVRFPYRFEKRLADLDGTTLRTSYRVTNRAPYPFPCFWSAHPLFAVKPTNRLVLPGRPRILVELSLSGRLGPYLTQHAWPLATDSSGDLIDLRALTAATGGVADKLYTSRLQEGWAAMIDVESREWLLFRFPAETVPYVGILAMTDETQPSDDSFIFAIEPCSGWPDRLDLAAERGACWTIPPRGSIDWHLDLTIGQGVDALERLVGSVIDLAAES